MDLQDWKDKLGSAFGVDPEAAASAPDEATAEALDLTSQQGKAMINVQLDKRNRKGKKVTLLTDFVADDDAIADLARELKGFCGVGGSSRGGEILLQGDVRDKVLEFLKKKGLKARKI